MKKKLNTKLQQYSDNNSGTENTDSSSEEEDEGENISSEEEQDLPKVLAKSTPTTQQRFGNTVEKTSREVDDTSDPKRITTKTITTSNTHTPTQTDSRTTITLETHSRHQHNNNQQRQVQQGTLEFLARFLAQNPQWQQLLGQAAQVNALTGAATNAADVATIDTAPKAEVADKVAFTHMPQGAVVVQTSVSSSTSSSSGVSSANSSSSGSNSSSNGSSDNSVKQQEKYEHNIARVNVELLNLEKNQAKLDKQTVVGDTGALQVAENIDLNKSEKQRIVSVVYENNAKAKTMLTQSKSEPEIQPHQHTTRLAKLTQIQQRKPTTTTTTTTPPTAQPNLFQIYTHELRKQLQYYLGFLRAHTGDNVSAGDSSSSILSNRKRTATVKQTVTTNTTNSNYSNTVSAAAKLQQQSALLDNSNRNNADDIDDNEDNVNDSNVDADDDASNEAIDDKQQKRKFNTATAISVSAQQQQNTQPAPPPSAPTRSSSNGGSNTNSNDNNNNNNNNKALQRPATFLDAYLKKLQALNAPTDTTATLTATTTSTTMSTSSVVGSGAVGKAVPAVGTHENEPVKRAPAETFGSHFLKLVNWKAFPF